MKPGTVLLVGLFLGGLTSLGYLVMPISVFVTGLLWVWLLNSVPRLPAVTGGLVGSGAIWLLLMARATWTCWTDLSCTQPSFVWVWFAPGVIFLAIGLLLVASGRSQLLER